MSKVAIIGAGPVGLCVALALSKAGHRVSLVSDGRQGAGWAAGGMLAPRYEVALETGVPVEAVADHGHWLMDCAGAAFARWDDLMQQAGAGPAAPVRAVTSAGVVMVRGDSVIDPRLWLGLLDRMVRAAGVSVVEGSVASVLPGTLILADGRHSDGFDAIVVASGFTRALLVPELVELIPVAGQLVRVEGHHLDGALRKGLIYLIDRGDHTVIGASARPGDDRALVHPASTEWLLDEAAGVLPALAGLPVSDAWAGVRPGSQDGLPLIGESSVPGVFVANGTYRNGWFLAPLVGQMISDGLAGRPIDTSFSPLRFLDW